MNVPNLKYEIFRGMNQDLATALLNPGVYFEAQNMRSAGPTSGQQGRLETFNGYGKKHLFSDLFTDGEKYYMVGGCNDEDSNSIYLFYYNNSDSNQHLIIRYREKEDDLQVVLRCKNLFTTDIGELDSKILNHVSIMNGYLAWSEGTGQPKMFNVDDAMNEVGPFAVSDKDKIPAEVFMLPYYTPLQEPYIDKFASTYNPSGDGFGFGTVDQYKAISLKDGHQFCYQFVHYNGMVSCLSAVSQIYFTNNFNVSLQLDDLRQLYNIDEYLPNTLDGDNDIRAGALEEATDFVTTLGMVKFVRFLTRLSNTGQWQLISELEVPQTLSSEVVTKIANLDDLSTEPPVLWLAVGNREDLKGSVLAVDDQNYVFSNIPRDVKDVLFADSRLFLGNFSDGYEVPTGLTWNVVRSKVSLAIGSEDHNFETEDTDLKVVQKFKDGDVKDFGIVFYDRYRRRSTVGYINSQYVYPAMYKPVTTLDYDGQSGTLGYDPYKLFLAQSGTFNRDDVSVTPWYAWLNDNWPYFDLFDTNVGAGTLPEWVEYFQVVVKESGKYNSFIQTMARPNFYYLDVEQGELLAGAKMLAREYPVYTSTIFFPTYPTNDFLDAINLRGIAFTLNDNEPYTYEEGDIVRVQMSQGILDKDNVYDEAGSDYYATFGYYDFKVEKQQGNVIFCSFPDELYDYINSLDAKTKTTLAGQPDIILLPPFYSEFRRKWTGSAYSANVGHINSNENEENGQYRLAWVGPTFYNKPDPNYGTFNEYEATYPDGILTGTFTVNNHFWKIDILKPNKVSTGVWRECGPAVNAKKYWGVDAVNWLPYYYSIWGDTYLRSFTHDHNFVDCSVKTVQYRFDTAPVTDTWEPDFEFQKLLGYYFCTHHETTTPVTIYGLNFNNAGRGQANTLTIVNQSIQYPTGVTFSGILREGGQFNELNRYAFDSIFEYPKEIGPITKMVNTSNLESVGTGILILGESLTVSARVGQVQFQDTGNGNLVGLTDKVLGSFQVMQDNFGCQDELTVYNKQGWCIFFDRKRNELVRYNRNGLTALGETYGMRKYLIEEVKRFNDIGASGFIHGGYDNRRKEYWLGFGFPVDAADYAKQRYLIFRDVDRSEGFIGFIEAMPIIPDFENIYSAGIYLWSTENKMFGYYFPGTDRIDEQYTGLLDLQDGVALENNDDTILTNLPSYLTAVFNSGKSKVRWGGISLQLHTNEGQKTIIQDVSGLNTPYEVIFECVDETIVLNSNTTIALASKIFGNGNSWSYREGRVSAAIRPAKIDLAGNNISLGGSYSGDPRTFRNILLQSSSLKAKIVLIPDRNPETGGELTPYYQRYLIFVQVKLTEEQPQPR